MKSERNINESLKQLHITAGSHLDERIHGAIDKTPAGKHTGITPEKGRSIMIGSFAKLAVAGRRAGGRAIGSQCDQSSQRRRRGLVSDSRPHCRHRHVHLRYDRHCHR